MKKRLLLLLFLSTLCAEAQSLKKMERRQVRRSTLDSNYASLRRVTIDYKSLYWEYIGMIRDFSMLKKKQISTEIGGSANSSITLNYGITNSIEISTGLVSSNTLLELPYVSLLLSHPVGNHLRLGVMIQTHRNVPTIYDTETKPTINPTINYGIQYQNNKILIAGSFFILAGGNKPTENVMINSANLLSMWRVNRRITIGLHYFHTNNPTFYSLPENWDNNFHYLPRTLVNTYDFQFKRSKLSIGSQVAYIKASLRQDKKTFVEVLPIIKYAYLIKQK